MADNGVQALEGTEEMIENAPPVAEGKKPEATPQAPAAGAAPTAQTEAQAEPVMPGAHQDTIRSVFVARTAASSEVSIGGFAQMETTADGLAVRGAYVAHLSVGETEAVAGDTAAEGDLLRKAYVARAAADAAAPARKRAPARPARRSAVKPARKAARTGAKKTARPRPAVKAKAKKRTAARAKPRAARRGNRRGRSR
jgi:hypothetical protein